MDYQPRTKRFAELFATMPSFRSKQMVKALFTPGVTSWQEAKNLPKDVRETLEKEVPWLSVIAVQVLESAKKDTFKAVLEVAGGKRIESVLMKNPRDQWTICVSSQVGCAMRCGFCATGKMGLQRSLEADEIVDQWRFWRSYLDARPTMQQRISNIVFMGMGEPLANYENVKSSLNTIFAYTDVGPTHVTVSTVGILPRLEQILTDKDWPPVRIAISLHSADPVTRKEIVPTSHDQFLPGLSDWTKRYLEAFGNRRHHLTFEYVMLGGVNDTEHHARLLAEFVMTIGNVKVNLIPYNFTDSEFACSPREQVEKFMAMLEERGVTVTTRRTMGDDIAAACGQLVTLSNPA